MRSARGGETRRCVALESPTYFGLLQIIESLGMKALEIPTHPRNGISLEALALAIQREKVKACILMPNVSNLLGGTMPEAAKKRLVRLLAAHEIRLIEDAVYSALHFGDAPPFAAKAYDRKGMVMLCSSFTKTLAPGLRVGWVAPGRYQAQVQMLKFISSVGVSDLLQLAIAEFLEKLRAAAAHASAYLRAPAGPGQACSVPLFSPRDESHAPERRLRAVGRDAFRGGFSQAV